MAIGAFWSLSGAVISRGLMLLASIIVARILGKTEYGELGMIRSTVNMFVVFAGFGLGLTATKYIAEYREKDKVKTGKIIGLSTIFAGVSGGLIALAILILAPYLATKTINAPHLVNELRLGAIMLFFSALNGAQTGTLAGYEAFKSIAKVNLIAGLVAFPIQIIFTLLWGLTGSVIGYGTNFLFLWFLNYVTVRKESKKFGVSINFFDSWDEWPVLYKFSLPALLSGTLVSPVMWACNAMMVNQPNGYNEMAVFDAANQWRILILYIPGAIGSIVLPLLTDVHSKNNLVNYRKLLLLNIKMNIIITLAFIIPISFSSNYLLAFYGESFSGNQLVLIFLAFSTVFSTTAHVIGQAIASTGKIWHGFIFNLIWAVIILTSTYILLNLNYGALGLAIAFVISYLIHTTIQSIYLNKTIIIK